MHWTLGKTSGFWELILVLDCFVQLYVALDASVNFIT